MRKSRRSLQPKTDSLQMDKIMSPDIRVINPMNNYQQNENSMSFHSNSIQQPFNGRRIYSSNRNSKWKSQTSLIRPKDTLNLFGGHSYEVKENMDQQNQIELQRGVNDFPSYDIFQKNSSMYQQLNIELSREIEKKNHFEAELSKMPMKIRKFRVMMI
jgi:hypothetical protein